jgi:hypothetical protein
MATAPSSPIVSVSDAISKLAPIFIGSGTTTTATSGTQTLTGSAAANQNLQQIINEALANETDPSKVTDLINNIMTNAAKAFAPTAGQAAGAGLYNSTTLSQMTSQAEGEATAQASKAVLDYKTSQQQIAQLASGNLLSANRTVGSSENKTAITAPAINPMTAILTAGGTYAAGKLAKGLGVDKVTDSAGNFVQSNVGDPIQNFLGIGPEQAATSAAQDAVGSSLRSAAAAGKPSFSDFVASGGDLASPLNPVGPTIDASSSVAPLADAAPVADATDAVAPVADAASGAAEAATSDSSLFGDLGSFFDSFF